MFYDPLCKLTVCLGGQDAQECSFCKMLMWISAQNKSNTILYLSISINLQYSMSLVSALRIEKHF